MRVNPEISGTFCKDLQMKDQGCAGLRIIDFGNAAGRARILGREGDFGSTYA